MPCNSDLEPFVEWDVVTGDDETLVVTFDKILYDPALTWKAEFRTWRSSTATLGASVTPTASADGAGNQVVVIELTNAQTRALHAMGAKVFDVQATDAASKVTTVLFGSLTFLLDVTL